MVGGRGAVPSLLRVHTLVGKPHGTLGAIGLERDQHRPVGAADREALTVLAEGADRRLDRLLLGVQLVNQRAELVAAHPVGHAPPNELSFEVSPQA